MTRAIVPLVGEAYGDAIPGERPELLDEPVVQFFDPLARKESNDFVSSVDELRSVFHRESTAYESATFPGSRVFQASSAKRTF